MSKNNDASKLADAWALVEKTARNAIEWTLNKENNSVQLVKNTSDSARQKLMHISSKARVMEKACKNRPGIGLFGESQAGKSYLVSTLACSRDNRLITVLGGNEYDFIKQINPQGGGKESTGLVTRFSSQSAGNSDDEYPVKLLLIKECEIAKILINSYFNDFKDAIGIEIDNIAQILDKGCSIQKKSTQLIDSDEILSLEDYVKSNYPKLYKQLGDNYWKVALSHLIYGSIEDRAEYYSCLWNRESELKKLFIKLSRVLNEIKSETVYAQIDSIIPFQNSHPSIIDVDALRELSKPSYSNTLKVKAGSKVIDVTVSELAAITAEIFIPVSNCKVGIINNMDLLDFPGYRGRLQVNHLRPDEPNDATGRSQLSELFLRGKVAYLFEKYTENYAVNCLIVCCSAQTQINSNIENVISRWIEKTQGATPDKRSMHQSGLFWAITKFDTRIGDDLNKDPSLLRYGSDGLLQQTILEKFGRCSWFLNWSGSEEKPEPFNNIFLVRKPGLLNCAFIESTGNDDGGKEELSLKDSFINNIENMKIKFIEEPSIKKYIKDPSEAWDAVLELNDGGMRRICHAIEDVDAQKIRYEAVLSSLIETSQEGEKILKQWYTCDNATNALEIKKQKWRDIVEFTRKEEEFYKRFGDFLSLTTLPEHKIKETYLINDSKYEDLDNADEIKETDSEKENSTTIEPVLDDDGWDTPVLPVKKNNGSIALSGSKEISSSQISSMSFGERIYIRWLDYLRNLSSNITEFERNNIPNNVIDIITEELVQFAERTELKSRLALLTDEVDKLTNSKEDACLMMFTVVENILSDYVHSLDNTVSDEKASEKFIAGTTIPDLPDEAPDAIEAPGTVFYLNWLKGLQKIIKDNANYTTSTGISTEQNNLLGNYIKDFIKCSKYD